MTYKNLNFCSLNVGSSNLLAGLPSLAVSENLDVVFIQENRLTNIQIEKLLPGFSAESNIDCDNPSRPGTAIAWRTKTVNLEAVTNISLCTLQVATMGSYRLVNIYAPSGANKRQERESFYAQDVFNLLQMSPKLSWIWAGDYNCILDQIDVEKGFGFQHKKSPSLKILVRAADVLDGFRFLHPRKEEFTFFRPGSAPSRLDRFYLSSNLSPNIKNVGHIATLSDHCGVSLTLAVNDIMIPPRKIHFQSYWKLNTAVLRDEDFMPSFKSFWNHLISSSPLYLDIADWWDVCAKPSIKQFCIEFSTRRKQQRSQTMNYLFSYLKLALTKKDWEEVGRVKYLLRQMFKEDTMGFLVRSRFKQNAEEERASLFHAARELKSNNHVDTLRIGGLVCKNYSEIEEEVVGFFGALFNGHHDCNLKNTGVPFMPDNSKLDEMLQYLSSLDRTDSDTLEEDIDIDELDIVVKECANNKAPGLDGLVYEFYKSVWPVIRKTFTMVLQCQLDRIKIIDSNRLGATRLISKVAGIPSVDELRPITLLNCDYKILAKLLVKRMKPILPTIIRSGQLCTVGKKNILFGVSNILSSILFTNQNNLGSFLISLDFFKAYDRVLISFLLLVMDKMGFGPRFCQWINMLHSGAQTKFILLKLSRAIDVCFSIRQGDPLSMILYIIFVEPLLIYIEHRVAGLTLPSPISGSFSQNQSVEAYCDDLNILSQSDTDLIIVDNAVRLFESVSGAILSRNKKCKVIGFGKWKTRNSWPIPYIETVSELKIFGIIFMNNYRKMLSKNWEMRFTKLQQTLISWSSRILDTLAQRVEVVKLFALSRIYYVASILPIPKNIVTKIEQAVGKFIWSSSCKFLRVSLNDLKLRPEKGGLALTCISSMSNSLILTQLLRLLKSEDDRAIGHISYWIGELIEDFMPEPFNGVHATDIPIYFQHLADIVAEAMISEVLSSESWRKVSNRDVYKSYTKTFPATKVELDLGEPMDNVWKKLCSPALEASTREILFLIIHNKLPIKERMFRVQITNDPYCDTCMNVSGCFIGDREHVFCLCGNISELWTEIRSLVDPLLARSCSNLDLLTLNFSSVYFETEVTWLIGAYVAELWSRVENNGKVWGRDELFGFLTFKFKNDQQGARLRLKQIPNFSMQ